MSILALNKVNYSYKNGKKVLNDISMEFEEGKLYAILGASGSGKSTLLSLLAGLVIVEQTVYHRNRKIPGECKIDTVNCQLIDKMQDRKSVV